ncbi:unnamed protein product [Leuciscus chuanchicus]
MTAIKMQLHFFDEHQHSEPGASSTSVDLDSQAQAAVPSQPQPPPLLLPNDLGTESPVQVCLQSYPGRLRRANRAYSTDIKLEAAGLVKSVSEADFKFIALMVHKILLLLDPANKILQAKETDLYTGLKLVHMSLKNDEQQANSSKRRRYVTKGLEQFVVESSCGQSDEADETECKRLFFSTLDTVIGEMSARFSERNSQLVKALCTLDPGSNDFLDSSTVKPLLDLTKTEIVDAEFTVARQFIRTETALSNMEKWTTLDVLKTFSGTLAAMPTVYVALRHGITFGASTATCENSFSTLTNVFTQHRRSMSHQRKAQLIHLAFERDLTAKFKEKEWHERLLRRFSAKSRRLQLF